MITAHLPAGYITGRSLAHSGPVVLAAVLGGIFPDLDLIRFYFVDGRSIHHHNYWVHVPAFWAIVTLVFLILEPRISASLRQCGWAFLLAVSVHILLDGLAGGIKWLWPLSDQLYYIVTVPTRFENWILNFILHPIFLFEIAIWAVAIRLWFKEPAGGTTP
ncbi:hypothetical protein ROA7450_01753 [Roseovarius albus]|uniref:Inner membrane protein YbcI n=1 Tax=Roseovarius albus TaxID=1247867 RepID=A0A1X6Z054_9RHOB|nr:metal-dependent hydrolase [Roseovarius albus]SLN36844.1 hypothetical protein ROA7450_01753 [Roseovarius albus]